MAVEGNKVFQWISRFDQATVTDDEFVAFKDAAESWILAQGAVGPAVASAPEEETTEAPGDAVKDDFETDWDK